MLRQALVTFGLDFGFGVLGFVFGYWVLRQVWELSPPVWNFRWFLAVSAGFRRFPPVRFWVSGLGFGIWVLGLGFWVLVLGLGCRVAGLQAPVFSAQIW